MKEIDATYFNFIQSISKDVIGKIIDRTSLVDEEYILDIVTAEAVDQIDYNYMVNEIRDIAKKVISKETNKLLEMLGEE